MTPPVSPESLPLRDIHMPLEPSWLPLATGWWYVLAAVLACLLLPLAAYLWDQLRPLRISAQARDRFAGLRAEYARHEDRRKLLRGASALLRRVMISLHPREEVASLTGEEWLRRLDEHDPDRRFSAGVGRVLLQEPYREQADFEPAALLALLEDWLRGVAKWERRFVRPGAR